MLKLVILPGLDGTTTLLRDFMDAARPTFDSVMAVAYPCDCLLSFDELERIARDALPKVGSFVLLGESFSGPIALSIAANPPAGLAGLVLSTTFANSPVSMLRPFAGLARFAPVHSLPISLLSWCLLGRWATPQLISALSGALHSVAASVLRSRASMALRVDVTACLSRITVPVLYLQATKDRLLRPGASKVILQGIPRTTLTRVAGPHLLLQAAPTRVADAVATFVSELEQEAKSHSVPQFGSNHAA